jgi:methylenetetrahydrofolate--tRNA-(uracil-5-)-methyltransferase
MGWLAGNNAARHLKGQELLQAPPRSAIGVLARYVSATETKNYQPVNITFALLEPLTPEQARSVRRKRDRHLLQVKLALEEWDQWLSIAWKEHEPVLAAAP